MEEENYLKRQRIYKTIMLVILTVFLTFILTTIYITNKLDLGKVDVSTLLNSSSSGNSISKSIDNIQKILKDCYLNEMDEEKMQDWALKGYVAGLEDPYTQYITKDEMEQYSIDLAGNYVGIGIYMAANTQNNTIEVIMPIKGSPAEEAGLLAGDVIISVDGIKYTGEDVDTEYQKQAHVFKSLYDVVVRLKNEENIPITAIIFWGTDDGNSWLQTSNSVGGSADGSRPQCPLLFDAEYNAKPAFWAFVDPSQLKPAIQEIIALETDDFNAAQTINAQLDDVYIDFTPVWSTEGVKVKMLIRDRSKDDNDAVTVYLDAADSRKEGADIASVTVERNTATSTDAQYEAEVFVEAKDIKAFDTLGFDISITDGDKVLSWNDTKNTQAKSSEYYGKLELKPFVTVSKGTISVDGSIDEAWNNAKELPLTIATAESAPPEATTVGKVLWDEDALYVLMEVTDPNMDVTGSEVHTQDSVEVFIDELNNKATSYDDNDKQYRVNCENQLSFNGSTCVEENITSYVTKTDTGYIVEMAIKWTTVKPENGTVIGFELQINDCKGGSRLGMLNWYDKTNTCYANPSCYGTARLVEEVAE